MLIRISLNDYIIEEDGASREQVTIFVSQYGEHALSSGIWHEVVKESENGEIDLVNGLIGIVNLYDAVEEGYGKEIFDFLCKNEDGRVRIDEYVMDNAICYPLHLSLLDVNGGKVGEIECNTKKDFTGYEKYSASDVWLYHEDTRDGLDAIKLQLESAMNMSSEAREYAMKLVEHFDYTRDVEKKGTAKATPTMGVRYEYAIQGEYGMLSLGIVRKEKNVAIVFFMAAMLWTLLVISKASIYISRMILDKSTRGKTKNVSTVMWITPFVGVVLITLFSRWTTLVWFWEDSYQMEYFKWILLATIALCIFINVALGEFASTIEENGIRSRRFIGGYRLFPYEKINEYAKTLKPFCYKNYLYIYYGETHLAFEILTSFGGKAFLKELSEKLNIDDSYFEEQMKGNQTKNFNMYYLMMSLEKAEKKRLREEKK